MRPLLLSLALAAPLPAAAQGVPSGQALALWEVLFENTGGASQMVLRFLAPGIADGYDQDAALGDLDWLCAAHADAIAATPYARADSVVVTLMDRPVPRGATDPGAIQYFEVYDLSDGRCISAEY